MAQKYPTSNIKISPALCTCNNIITYTVIFSLLIIMLLAANFKHFIQIPTLSKSPVSDELNTEGCIRDSIGAIFFLLNLKAPFKSVCSRFWDYELEYVMGKEGIQGDCSMSLKLWIVHRW